MKVTETAAGTPVIEQTKEEYDAYLERQVHNPIGMTVAEFTDAYLAGELEDGDVAVDEIVGMLVLHLRAERETRAAIGMSLAEFTDAYLSGNLDHADPTVHQLVGQLRTNSHLELPPGNTKPSSHRHAQS